MTKTLILDYFGVVFEDGKLNDELLMYVQTLVEKGWPAVIYTSGFVHDVPEVHEKLDPLISTVYTTVALGSSKAHPEGYKILLEIMNKQSNEVVFIDDTAKNIKAARGVGITAIKYTSVEDLRANMQLLVE